MTKNQKINLAVIMGGRSSEHEVSLKTGENIIQNLNREKYNILPIKLRREDNAWLLGNRILDLRVFLKDVDVVLNAMHGEYGEDGRMQAILEYFDTPYTGSGVLASALAFDKIKSRELFRFNGLTVPASIVLDLVHSLSGDDISSMVKNFSNPPWVIKPAEMGSSVGVSIVNDEARIYEAAKMAFSYGRRILIEEYIEGAEVTCGVLENFNDEKVFALPVTEIVPKKHNFFSYEAKYDAKAADEITPARINDETRDKVQAITKKAHEIMGCRAYSRADMIIKGDKIYLLEVNTLPGLTEVSLYPQAAKVAGLEFPRLLDKLVEEAMER